MEQSLLYPRRHPLPSLPFLAVRPWASCFPSLSLLFGTWEGTHSLAHTQEARYHLSYVPSPFACILLLRQGLDKFAHAGF
jgi:hypothetical protein